MMTDEELRGAVSAIEACFDQCGFCGSITTGCTSGPYALAALRTEIGAARRELEIAQCVIGGLCRDLDEATARDLPTEIRKAITAYRKKGTE